MNDDIISETLKKHFTNWIERTLNINDNYKLLKKIYFESGYKLDLKKEDLFLQFNYTLTLEKIYDIDDENILYIHGKCGEDLIVGHGNDDKIRHIENEIDELEKDYLYIQSQNNRITENYCILRYLQKTRKDTDSCRRDAKLFYKSKIKKNVEKICVYGLSMGDVDLPYLEDIRKMYPEANWYFYCFSDEDENKANFVAINNLKLNNLKYETMKFDNPLSRGISKVLFELYNIK
ncbi:AbiH family protein [Fusibacter bizertensis]|uniref:AbiH family protein n=1 Tax=Fusibacter bizertensis TaxID=1488331 RepID=A0ABT6N955_9FIRM|nr:AbiH family protein [Fusibacter bizertensis]MDH8676951.1 AbiH family protein [Fusibacter bizertensis]